ncbi:Ribonuclease H superfamily protein [Trifolium repens]|nr:Ribonuclease H superfamily protein [Trifolium repens]
MLLWRIMQEAIPVKSALNHRGVQCQILCPRCFQKEETIDHIFMKCHHATRIWFGSKLGVNFSNCNLSFVEWLQNTINSLKDEDLSYVAALIYGIWLARNQQVFNLRNVDNTTVIEQANRSIQEFQIITSDMNNGLSQHVPSSMSNNQSHRSKPRTNKKWARPDYNKIKINCDANLAIEGRWGLGTSFRNSDGALLLAATWTMPGSNDSKLAEAYALYAAVLLAVEHGFQEVIFESDNSVIIDLINNDGNPRLYLGNILSGVCRNTGRFSSVCFSFINREANKVAHWLASLAHTEYNKVWINGTPPSQHCTPPY